MTRLAILDTSVFIAVEQDRGLSRPLPDQIGVSVVTLAELELGVLVAADSDTRALRLATLTRLREQTAGIPIDDRVGSAYARLAARQLARRTEAAGPRHLDRRDRPRPRRRGLDPGRRLQRPHRRRHRADLTEPAHQQGPPIRPRVSYPAGPRPLSSAGRALPW